MSKETLHGVNDGDDEVRAQWSKLVSPDSGDEEGKRR